MPQLGSGRAHRKAFATNVYITSFDPDTGNIKTSDPREARFVAGTESLELCATMYQQAHINYYRGL